MICVDTNVVIAILGKRDPALSQRVNHEAKVQRVCLPSICLFELELGVANSQAPLPSALRLAAILRLPLIVLPFEGADARDAADIRADLKRKGMPIGPYDVLIAAQARCRGLTLVTANIREFARVPRLAVEDWSTPT